jgi:Na+/H+ antiporter NhaD/arsenite permease-like protein
MDVLAISIFIITYIGIIFTRLPWINIDRPSAAFFGAVAMIVLGVISFEDAIYSIDFHTIALLLGMMIIIAQLESEEIFSNLASKLLKKTKNTRGFLNFIVFTTGIGSAFLVNDAVVIFMTPIVIQICKKAKIQSLPYLIAIILSANAGSVMTITGNPQNMLIGITSGISYAKFFFHLFPVSLLSMILIIYLLRLFYRSEFRKDKELKIMLEKQTYFQSQSKYFTMSVFILLLVGFFISRYIQTDISILALTAASLLLLFGRSKPSVIVKDVDWVLLLFFASLFIVVKGFESTSIFNQAKHLLPLDESLLGNIQLHISGLIISQIISNVPYSIAMIPLLKPYDSDVLWLILASSSTLAGNATIIGAIANLIVIESARKFNVHISFWEFFKVGIIFTILTFIVSICNLFLQDYFNLI